MLKCFLFDYYLGGCPGNDLVLENNKANNEVVSEVVGEESQAHNGVESGQSQRFGEKAGSGQSQRKKPLTGYHLHLRELSVSVISTFGAFERVLFFTRAAMMTLNK